MPQMTKKMKAIHKKFAQEGCLLLGHKSMKALRALALRKGGGGIILAGRNRYIDELFTAIYEESGIEFEELT